jgi:hypothetical protein
MDSINGSNAILQQLNMCTNLEMGVPPSVTIDLWRDNHLIPKFSYGMQDCLEEPTDGLTRSPESEIYDSEPLIMPNNMQEHVYLLLNSSIDAVSGQLSSFSS